MIRWYFLVWISALLAFALGDEGCPDMSSYHCIKGKENNTAGKTENSGNCSVCIIDESMGFNPITEKCSLKTDKKKHIGNCTQNFTSTEEFSNGNGSVGFVVTLDALALRRRKATIEVKTKDGTTIVSVLIYVTPHTDHIPVEDDQTPGETTLQPGGEVNEDSRAISDDEFPKSPYGLKASIVSGAEGKSVNYTIEDLFGVIKNVETGLDVRLTYFKNESQGSFVVTLNNIVRMISSQVSDSPGEVDLQKSGIKCARLNVHEPRDCRFIIRQSLGIVKLLYSDGPREKTVHGKYCLNTCAPSSNSLYYFCATTWWFYDEKRWMNWDLCGKDGNTAHGFKCKSPDECKLGSEKAFKCPIKMEDKSAFGYPASALCSGDCDQIEDYCLPNSDEIKQEK